MSHDEMFTTEQAHLMASNPVVAYTWYVVPSNGALKVCKP